MELGNHIASFGGKFKHIARHVVYLVIALVMILLVKENNSGFSLWAFAAWSTIGMVLMVAILYGIAQFSKLHVYENGISGRSTYGLKSVMRWEDIAKIYTYSYRSAHQVAFKSSTSKRNIDIDQSIFAETDLQKILQEKIPLVLEEFNEQ